MPTHNQKTVDVVATTRAKGQSDTESLKSIFATSPIHAGNVTREERLALYQSLISNGGTDGGHTFGEFTFNYLTNGAPNYATIDENQGGGGGDAHNSKVPNPASPGEGNGIDSSKVPKGPEEFAKTHNSQFGTGQGSDLSPSTSSGDIASHKIKDYDMGISPKNT